MSSLLLEPHNYNCACGNIANKLLKLNGTITAVCDIHDTQEVNPILEELTNSNNICCLCYFKNRPKEEENFRLPPYQIYKKDNSLKYTYCPCCTKYTWSNKIFK
jgi:hypothetical protein